MNNKYNKPAVADTEPFMETQADYETRIDRLESIVIGVDESDGIKAALVNLKRDAIDARADLKAIVGTLHKQNEALTKQGDNVRSLTGWVAVALVLELSLLVAAFTSRIW